MKTLPQWLAAYGVSHQNRTNQVIHKICVPVIFFCVVSFLLLIPYSLGPVSIGEVLILLALLWYLSLGFKAFGIAFVQVVVSYLLFQLLRQQGDPLGALLILFILAWVGQFVGHKIEGKKPSFIEDLQFLLIGPLWVFRFLF